MNHAGTLPFAIRREADASLTDQVFEGVRKGIVSGFWKRGARLPTRAELVSELGVSKNVVQAAVGRLVRKGLIVSRPNCGCLVTNGASRNIYGRVIEVTPGCDCSFWHTAFIQTLQGKLARERVSCVSVSLPRDKSRRLDFSQLDYEVDKGADLIVATVGVADRSSVWRHLEQLGVKFVWRGCRPVRSGGAHLLTAISADRRQADGDFVEACRRSGILSVLLLSFGVEKTLATLQTDLEKDGICVENLSFPRSFFFQTLDELVQGVRDLMVARLKRGALCDLVYSNDDYMTMGALAALNGRGLRIPDDVRLVSLRNRGFGPVLDKSLAAIECDPVDQAEKLAVRVLAWFKTGAFDPLSDCPVYVPGETFPVPGGLS